MNYKKILWFLVALAPVLLLILGYIFPSAFFSNQDALRNYLESFGVWAPIMFILLQIIQVVITPFSHYVVGILGGYMFGTWLGFIYNLIGRIIGTLIAFYLARKYGRFIIQKLVKKKTIKKYDKLFEKGKSILFLMYFLPLFPDDELSYLAGFSSIRSKIFLPLMALGHIGGSLGLAYIGSGLSYSDPLFIIWSILTLVAGFLFLKYYKKFK